MTTKRTCTVKWVFPWVAIGKEGVASPVSNSVEAVEKPYRSVCCVLNSATGEYSLSIAFIFAFVFNLHFSYSYGTIFSCNINSAVETVAQKYFIRGLNSPRFKGRGKRDCQITHALFCRTRKVFVFYFCNNFACRRVTESRENVMVSLHCWATQAWVPADIGVTTVQSANIMATPSVSQV